jgi:hypothetical protein
MDRLGNLSSGDGGDLFYRKITAENDSMNDTDSGGDSIEILF